jgi:hypothetical protein
MFLLITSLTLSLSLSLFSLSAGQIGKLKRNDKLIQHQLPFEKFQML